ncbi:tudor domain-containing protein 7-like [Anneissia japonica]|uniref:tudor domain-containing protein 7-like n=1 Tax=Anneissia japonica TaxID=1529436 RepID=UPI0014256456|nr:tudor domain-containing protein 7-like [Anneissia japonica]XP_033121615.1 tudor domain-containing protein 7-like [Anneissia japonica]XP_033121616.1 tudor domain-containing protein 7-like [Anneissia japonica]
MAQPEDVKKLLRSLLISQKGGVPLQLLASDYRSLIGDHIPFNRFGFRTLEEYLKSIPDVVTIQRGSDGAWICCPVADAASAHVHSLVSRQRTQKKRKVSKKTSRYPSKPPFFASRRAPVQRNYGPQSATKSRPPANIPRRNISSARRVNLGPLLSSVPRNGISGPSLKPVKVSTQQANSNVESELPPRMQRRLGAKSAKPTKPYARSSSKSVAISNLPSSFTPDLIKKHFEDMKPVDARLDKARRCVIMKFENASAYDVRDQYDGSLFKGSNNTVSKISVTVELDEGEASALQRIQKIVEDKPHGLWRKNLSDEYRKLYCEDMPLICEDDLVSVVTVEKLHNNIILYPKLKVTIQGKGKMHRIIRNEIPKVTIPPPVLKPVKSRVVVYVSYILSCSEFFVQYDDSPIEEIAQRLSNQCESCSLPMTRYSKGEFCAAQYSEDNNWCRAKILEVHRAPKAVYNVEQGKEQDEIQVFFLDYGNQESLRPTSLQFLTPVFGNEPAQAVRCSLNSINPLQSEKRFSAEANTRFRQLTKHIPLLMTVEDIVNDTCIVDLVTEKDVNIAQKLCQEELVDGMSPPPLIYPERTPWEVSVTYSTSTTEFCIQFEEYSEEFEALEAELNSFYGSRSHNSLSGKPELGKAYAICTGNSWYRVVVCGFAEKKVMCHYVDYGDREVLDWSQFEHLEKKFLNLPFQSVRCSLANLAQFASHEKVFRAFIDQTADKVLIAEQTGKKTNPMEVVLYDNTGPGDDVNINELLAKLVEDEDLAPQLPKVGKKIDGYVCHVEDDGTLSVQIPGPGLERLEESLMVSLAKHFSKPSSAAEFIVEPKVGKLCCAKFSQDNNWYRGIITSVVSDTKVGIKFVDYGNTEIVSMTSIREPMINNTTLITLPYQAVPCVLEGVPPADHRYKWGSYASSWLFDLLDNRPVSIEVVRGQTKDKAASVIITTVENPIVVNDSMIELADELFLEEKYTVDIKDISQAKDNAIESADSNANISKLTDDEAVDIVKIIAQVNINPEKQLRRPSLDLQTSPTSSLLKRLPMPPSLEIPGVGEYWDVVISNAKDPSHFVCQPFVQSEHFQAMLLQMKQYYSTSTFRDLPSSGIQEGEIYAVCLNDQWQRAQVCEGQRGEYVNVYRIDEGDFDIVDLKDIRPLTLQFRKLPFQGVIAKLSGVVPADNYRFYSDEASDCFQKLVKGKAFVSTIKEKVEESFHKFKLVVDLTDTSNEDYDIFIDSVLIESNVAVKA